MNMTSNRSMHAMIRGMKPLLGAHYREVHGMSLYIADRKRARSETKMEREGERDKETGRERESGSERVGATISDTRHSS